MLNELRSIRDTSENVDERIVLGIFLTILRAAEGGAGGWVEFESD